MACPHSMEAGDDAGRLGAGEGTGSAVCGAECPSMTCDHCDQPWEVASPGTDEIRDIFLLRAVVADRRWCIPHAREAGFPWLKSEKGRAA